MVQLNPLSSRPEAAHFAAKFSVISTGGGPLCRRSGEIPAFRLCTCLSCCHSLGNLLPRRAQYHCHTNLHRRRTAPLRVPLADLGLHPLGLDEVQPRLDLPHRALSGVPPVLAFLTRIEHRIQPVLHHVIQHPTDGKHSLIAGLPLRRTERLEDQPMQYADEGSAQRRRPPGVHMPAQCINDNDYHNACRCEGKLKVSQKIFHEFNVISNVEDF
jgi:hypothetical protein